MNIKNTSTIIEFKLKYNSLINLLPVEIADSILSLDFYNLDLPIYTDQKFNSNFIYIGNKDNKRYLCRIYKQIVNKKLKIILLYSKNIINESAIINEDKNSFSTKYNKYKLIEYDLERIYE